MEVSVFRVHYKKKKKTRDKTMQLIKPLCLHLHSVVNNFIPSEQFKHSMLLFFATHLT